MALKDSNEAKHYLFVYNFIQFIGWTFILIVVLAYVSRKGTFIDVYPEVQIPLSIFQTLQLLEVVHCLVRLVPSNPIQTFVQIFSRLFIVWGILLPVVESRNSIGVPILLFAWSVAELTRYIYYALNVYKTVPYVLVWIRYTFFIVLYPMGATGELLTIISAYPYVRDRKLFAIELPNFANVSFYYHIFMLFMIFCFIPVFPRLYFYMIRQRIKVLGKNSKRTLVKNSEEI